MANSKIEKYLSLFIPSALGMVLYVFLSGLAIVLEQFSDIKNSLQIPAYVHVGRSLAHFANRVLTGSIGETKTETLVVGLFWGVVGLVVYLFLRGLARFIAELDDDISVRHYVWPKGYDRGKPLRLLAERAAFRFVAAVVLLLVVTGPLLRVIHGPVFVDFLGTSKFLQYVVWFVVGIIVWHIVVILLRLIALRARLLG